MNSIISWVKQIFVLSILSGLVVHLMPSSKYEQHVRFICGIVITAACIAPFVSLVSGGSNLWDTYHSVLDVQEVEELKRELQFNASEGDEAVLKQYREATVSVIEEKVLNSGLYPVSTQVVMDTDPESADYGAVQQLDLTVSLSREERTEVKIAVEEIRISGDSGTGQGRDEQMSVDPKVTELKTMLAGDYQISLSNVRIRIGN